MKKIIAIFIMLIIPLNFSYGALSAPTQLVDETSTTTSSTYTTASFSVTAGDLVIVTCGCGNPSGVVSLEATTDSFTSMGDWTEQVDRSNTATNAVTSYIATAVAGASESGTITLDPNGSFTRWTVQVFVVTGYNTSNPVPQTASSTNSGTGTLTVTLGSTPATDSMVFGLVTTIDGGLPIATPGANFTELDESLSGAVVGSQDQYDLDNADTTCDWSDLDTRNQAGGCIEIAAEAGGGGGVDITSDLILFE